MWKNKATVRESEDGMEGGEGGGAYRCRPTKGSHFLDSSGFSGPTKAGTLSLGGKLLFPQCDLTFLGCGRWSRCFLDTNFYHHLLPYALLLLINSPPAVPAFKSAPFCTLIWRFLTVMRRLHAETCFSLMHLFVDATTTQHPRGDHFSSA